MQCIHVRIYHILYAEESELSFVLVQELHEDR